ncbi:MAG: nitronate monooxygenase, partial [Gammaproteobacteria bacterium]|nr:nitronate monooxygenase [Gammaproteobacteria bacterium]
IWGCGQGIGAVTAIVSAGDLVERLNQEYTTAHAKIVSNA